MKTYWDLSQKERASLSADQVEEFIDAELMTRGVLKAEPPKLEPEPSIAALPKRLVYRVQHKTTRWGSKETLPIAFASREDAAAFLALAPMLVELNYYEGTSIEGTGDLSKAEITVEEMAEQSAVAVLAPSLSKVAAIRSANDKAKAAYETAVREQNQALAEMWEDWSKCASLDREHADTVRRLDDYVRTAGDETLGSAFLHKVFDGEKIRQACEWFGRDYPEPNPPQAARVVAAGVRE